MGDLSPTNRNVSRHPPHPLRLSYHAYKKDGADTHRSSLKHNKSSVPFAKQISYAGLWSNRSNVSPDANETESDLFRSHLRETWVLARMVWTLDIFSLRCLRLGSKFFSDDLV